MIHLKNKLSKTLFLLIIALSVFTICSCETEEDEEETWDYVFSIEDVKGWWTKTEGNYFYYVWVFDSGFVSVSKKNTSTGEYEISDTYSSGTKANAYIAKCKINSSKTKLICPTFGSSIVLEN